MPVPTDPTEPEPETCAPETPYPDPPVVPTATLTQTSLLVDFEELDSANGAAVVQAVCLEGEPDATGAIGEQPSLIVSADDSRESGTDVVVAIPDEIDPTLYEPGEPIAYELDPSPEEGEPLTLGGISSDDGSKGADDEETGQGTLG